MPKSNSVLDIEKSRRERTPPRTLFGMQEYKVMEAKPTAPAGAISLLGFVAELIEGSAPDDDEHEHFAGAIRNAADFFEGRASA
jgi:hypothetical protein